MQRGSEVQGIPLPFTPFKLINGFSGKPLSASNLERVPGSRDLSGKESKDMPCNALAGLFQLQPVGRWTPAYQILNLEMNQVLAQGKFRKRSYPKVTMQNVNQSKREAWEIIPCNFFPDGNYVVQNAYTGWQLAWDSAEKSRPILVPRIHEDQELKEDDKRRMWMFSLIEEGIPSWGIPPTQTLFKLKNVGTGEFIRADSKSSSIVPYKKKLERRDLQFRLVAPKEQYFYPSSYLIESVGFSKFLCAKNRISADETGKVFVKFETLNERDLKQYWSIIASERSSEGGSYVITNCGTDAVLRYELDPGIAYTVWGTEVMRDSSKPVLKQMIEASAVGTITTSIMQFNGCRFQNWTFEIV